MDCFPTRPQWLRELLVGQFAADFEPRLIFPVSLNCLAQLSEQTASSSPSTAEKTNSNS